MLCSGPVVFAFGYVRLKLVVMTGVDILGWMSPSQVGAASHAVESAVNVREWLLSVMALFSTSVEKRELPGIGVAYSIALGSGVAAFTLWDRPCYPHLFFPPNMMLFRFVVKAAWLGGRSFSLKLLIGFILHQVLHAWTWFGSDGLFLTELLMFILL